MLQDRPGSRDRDPPGAKLDLKIPVLLLSMLGEIFKKNQIRTFCSQEETQRFRAFGNSLETSFSQSSLLNFS